MKVPFPALIAVICLAVAGLALLRQVEGWGWFLAIGLIFTVIAAGDDR